MSARQSEFDSSDNELNPTNPPTTVGVGTPTFPDSGAGTPNVYGGSGYPGYPGYGYGGFQPGYGSPMSFIPPPLMMIMMMRQAMLRSGAITPYGGMYGQPQVNITAVRNVLMAVANSLQELDRQNNQAVNIQQ